MDMPNEDELEAALPDAARQRVQCVCDWVTMDTGNAFYSRREPNPDCPAHPLH